MPYEIVRVGNSKYAVINTKTAHAYSYGTSLANAQAQMRLLYSLHGKSRNRRSRNRRSKKR